MQLLASRHLLQRLLSRRATKLIKTNTFINNKKILSKWTQQTSLRYTTNKLFTTVCLVTN